MEIEVEDLKRHELRARDIFFFQPKRPISAMAAQEMQDVWNAVLPDHRLVIVGIEGELTVGRGDPASLAVLAADLYPELMRAAQRHKGRTGTTGLA